MCICTVVCSGTSIRPAGTQTRFPSWLCGSGLPHVVQRVVPQSLRNTKRCCRDSPRVHLKRRLPTMNTALLAVPDTLRHSEQ